MKHFLLFFFVLNLFAWQLALAASPKPKVPTVSSETKTKVESTADTLVEGSTLLTETFAVRQQAILKATDEALTLLQQSEKNVQGYLYLTTEQKATFLKLINDTEALLNTYKKDISACKTSEELYNTNKAMLKQIVANKEKIKETVGMVILIGIKGVIDSADLFFDTAIIAAGALKGCKVDTSSVDTMIQDGVKNLNELKTVYDKLNADQKITIEEEELNNLKKATKLSAEISTQMLDITLEMEELAGKCPLLAE